ncbi:hypothetical protein B0G57_14119 [Trinickia symbiotica]|nr:hypothetical protein [Trinickia symbiotica]PPK41091.1 hypothetical protein B0G57_14119 [Trinickia symbiotica]
MTQETGKTVSAEQAMKRAETMQAAFLAFIFTLPLVGMIFGFIFACATAGRIFGRSAQVNKDLTVAAITTAVAALGMLLSWFWMFKGGGIVALIVDFGFNFWILRRIVLGSLRHVWA